MRVAGRQAARRRFLRGFAAAACDPAAARLYSPLTPSPRARSLASPRRFMVNFGIVGIGRLVCDGSGCPASAGQRRSEAEGCLGQDLPAPRHDAALLADRARDAGAAGPIRGVEEIIFVGQVSPDQPHAPAIVGAGVGDTRIEPPEGSGIGENNNRIPLFVPCLPIPLIPSNGNSLKMKFESASRSWISIPSFVTPCPTNPGIV